MKDAKRMDAERKNTGRNNAGMTDAGMKDGKTDYTGMKHTKRDHAGIKDTGMNGEKRADTRLNGTQNKRGYLNPEEDPRFHDTYKFLRRYRDATYSLKVVVRQMETRFRMEYGTSVDDFLDSIYAAGVELSGEDIAERAKSIERSNRMLKLLDSSVELLRNNHKHGEQYYWILYYSFLSPQELKDTNEIIEQLAHHISNISYRTYYRKRHEAIAALSTILWGFTAKETLDILNKFFPED